MQYLSYIIEGIFGAGILSFMWKLAKDSENKIDTVFRRFDKHKRDFREEFVNKDVCKIIHEHTSKDIERLERKMELGFKNLDDKVTLILRRNGVK